MSNPTNEANAYAETIAEDAAVSGLCLDRGDIYTAWMGGYDSAQAENAKLREAGTLALNALVAHSTDEDLGPAGDAIRALKAAGIS